MPLSQTNFELFSQVDDLFLLQSLNERNQSQSASLVEYIDFASADGLHPHSMSVQIYDSKPCNGKAPALELSVMQSTLLLPLFLGPLWPRVVGPDRVLSMGQIELFDI